MDTEMPHGEVLKVKGGAVGTDSVGAAAVLVGNEDASQMEIAVVNPRVLGELAVVDGVLDKPSEAHQVGGANGVVGDVFVDVVQLMQPDDQLGPGGVDGELLVASTVPVARPFAVDGVVGPVDRSSGEQVLVERGVEEGHRERAEHVGVVVDCGVGADLGSCPAGSRGKQQGDGVRVGAADPDQASHERVAGIRARAVGDDGAGEGVQEGVGGGSRDGRIVGQDRVDPGWVAADDGSGGAVDGLVAVHVVLRSLMAELYERCGFGVPGYVPGCVPGLSPWAFDVQESHDFEQRGHDDVPRGASEPQRSARRRRVRARTRAGPRCGDGRRSAWSGLARGWPRRSPAARCVAGSVSCCPSWLGLLVNRVSQQRRGVTWRLDLPSPTIYWICTSLVAVVGVALVVGSVLLWRRWSKPTQRRLGVEVDARMATLRDVRPIVVESPVPPTGRMLLGRLAKRGPMLATEDRERHPASRRWEARQGDRGSVALIGPTRSGKTVLASAGIIAWDGPVIAMSVKRDLYDATAAARAMRGDIAVFDPSSVTGLPTARWTPLRAIATTSGAARAGRALAQAIPTNGVTGGDYWKAHGETLTTAYMSLAGLSMLLPGDSGQASSAVDDGPVGVVGVPACRHQRPDGERTDHARSG